MRVRNQLYERTLPILGGILVAIGLLLACSETPAAVNTPAATFTIIPSESPFPSDSAGNILLNCITNAFGSVEVSTDDVTLLIDKIHACRCDPLGTPVTENHGYVYIAVAVRVINRSNTITVNPNDIVLLDEFENTYRKYAREHYFNRQSLPYTAPQTSERGTLIYPVPFPCAHEELWIQWKQGTDEIKVEIIQPLEGPGWSE